MFDKERPYVVFRLLQYEYKSSLLNLQITRDTAYEEPVRSKDPMILHMGYQRYTVKPIYSQNSKKGGNNVHKYEWFLQMGRSPVATAYGPVVFGKVPCMLHKETEDSNEPILVSTGMFMNTDVKRIVAKRIILSGHPFRVHKRSAVIWYMFLTQIISIGLNWSYSLPIRKGGAHLGIGGNTRVYEVTFDGPMTQQDTVMLSLYKHIFPKYTTELYKGGLIKEAKAIEPRIKTMPMDME